LGFCTPSLPQASQNQSNPLPGLSPSKDAQVSPKVKINQSNPPSTGPKVPPKSPAPSQKEKGIGKGKSFHDDDDEYVAPANLEELNQYKSMVFVSL
jgi:hypothetical protein